LNPELLPHRRKNLLTGDWVLVSPQRALRPWQGRQETPAVRAERPRHDPHCYLCAGNRRVNGQTNPDYRGPWVFDNDHPALLPEAADLPSEPLLQAEATRGRSRVICFSPDHARGLPELEPAEILALIDTWCAETEALGQAHAWVQVFENKGELMGCSQPHPHGQIWATAHLPGVAVGEDREQRAHFAAHGRPLLLDYARRELQDGARTVLQTAHWLVLVPWWAAWPFETLLLPLAPVSRLPELDAPRRHDLALLLKRLTQGYDRLFDCSFPYSMGWHGAPTRWPDGGDASAAWTLHAHVFPPLLRSATVRKFMVGYEMLAEVQRDLTPEQAAARLREVMP
jgi:UDPglucose--hexose-1-phosphate uridylyltransferase